MRFVKPSETEQPDWGFHPSHAPIVGLWAFRYISKGNSRSLGIPDGAIVDGGNALWFEDGNEMTSSGVRAPETGSVCLGIWRRTGETTYELTHVGLSWDPVYKTAAGPAFIKQYVTLGRGGNEYTGTFTINQLQADGKTPALPAPVTGTVVATRVTIDTDSQESALDSNGPPGSRSEDRLFAFSRLL
jgi:hypothetical protein